MNADEWPIDDLVDPGLVAQFEGSLSGLTGLDGSAAAASLSSSEFAGIAAPLPAVAAAASLSSSSGGGRFVSPGSGSDQSSEFSQLERQLELSMAGRFRFSLLTGTSPAVRASEDPLTYLNQGQAYEVRMSYCGGLDDRPRLLRSVFRVAFHERRMQFMERDHLDFWRRSRPGERILDIDGPLSYNLLALRQLPGRINAAEAVWEGGGEGSRSRLDCGVFVRLHCVSTEFTARKHGGEKGVPFRLRIDTYDHATGARLVSVAAQVKVFKPKGADRKQKTDREKSQRRADFRTRYQAPMPYTPFLAVADPEADEGGSDCGGDPGLPLSIDASTTPEHRQIVM